jgi:hypothetical protein
VRLSGHKTGTSREERSQRGKDIRGRDSTGHIVLGHEPAKMYVTPDGLMMMSEYNTTHEEEATWFAGAILVPRDALLDVVRRGISDAVAADQFGVSIAVFQMRRNRTGVDIQLSRRRGTWAP